jgi:pimeloyl-ACP methyl ester carboxylesterase
VSGVLCLDPLGAVGDGGEALFEAEMFARLPEENRQRAKELDDSGLAGEATAEEGLEGMRLVWPAYFADWDAAPPLPPFSMSAPAYSEGFASLRERRSALEAALPTIRVPLGIVAGARSPMPAEEAAVASAAAIPGAWVEVVEGGGHFPWIERPGCVRSALERLARG